MKQDDSREIVFYKNEKRRYTAIPFFTYSMNKIIPLLALAMIVVGGMFTYDQYQMHALSQKLITETTAIEKGYNDIVDQSVLPLANSPALLDIQKREISHMRSMRAELAQDQSVLKTVSLIHDLQLSLVLFIQSIKPDQPFAESEPIAMLKQEMSENSHMRALLTAYNETAKQWNDRVQGHIGILSADVLQPTNELLPYLRFDGQQEYLTTIKL